jgi:precorrin-6A/cobalt-precorrin-6A reductase
MGEGAALSGIVAAAEVRVLILGGTAEARELAGLLHGRPGVWCMSSLAGRVRDPRLPVGHVRVGGFGGADGLAGWLSEHRVDVVVDATHPYAATMRQAAVRAAEMAGVGHLRVERAGWTAQPGDRWHRVPDAGAAATLVSALGSRVFLTTGRQSLYAFTHMSDLWFLARVVDEPDAVPSNVQLILDRGPYTVDGERKLLTSNRIEVLVTKDSGGEYTVAKLVAARGLALPVVMIDRPEPVATPAVVRTADEAVAWLGLAAPAAGQGACG